MTASKIQHPKCLFTPYGSGLRSLCMTIEKGWQEFIYYYLFMLKKLGRF